MTAMWKWTNSLYCAICGAPFERPETCYHEDAEHDNPAENDESWNVCFGVAYDSRKLSQEDREWWTDLQVVGKWTDIDTTLENLSSSQNFFISGPASLEWRDYGEPNCPSVPTRDNGSVQIEVYCTLDKAEGMLFPVHKVCHDIVTEMCDYRQSRTTPSTKPNTPEQFYDAFTRCRYRNVNTPSEGHGGGLEWPHKAYGVTQCWSDGWDCIRGGEIFCAKPILARATPLSPPLTRSFPSDMRFISKESGAAADKDCLPRAGDVELDQRSDTDPTAESFAFSRSSDTTLLSIDDSDSPEQSPIMPTGGSHTGSDTNCAYNRWEEHIKRFIEQADQSDNPEEVLEGANTIFADAPLQIQNRWRIFKILQAA